MIDSAVSDAIEAGRVPEGVSAEYLSDSKDLPATAAIIVITAVTLILVMGRALSRGILVGRFGFDDGLAVLGLFHLIAFSTLCVELIRIGSGRHYEYIQFVMPAQTVKDSEVLDFAAHLVYTTALLVCRLSGLAFYHRICGEHRRFAIAIRITAGVLSAGYLPQMCLIIFHCLPVTGYWPYDWEPHYPDYKCLAWGVVYVVNSGVSLVCDFILFGIPVAMLWMLEIPRKRKVHLAGILMPGILVVGISITRLVLVVKGQWEPDMSWSYNPMLAVEVSEIGATLIALSVPGLKPLVDKFILGKDIEGRSRGASRKMAGSGTAAASGPIHTYHSDQTAVSGDSYQGLHSRSSPKLFSNETLQKHIQSRYDVESNGQYRDKDDTSSTDGILVRIDFNVREEQQQRQQQQKVVRPR